MTPEERIKSGELYPCSIETESAELDAKHQRCKELLYEFNQTRPCEGEKRSEILRQVLAECGENCYIEPPFYANWGCNVHVGKDFYANFHLTAVDDTDIFIGDNVMIGPNVTLATAGHPIAPELREQVYQFNQPIRIGDRVWLGAGCIVLPGVTIGNDTVIGAGSVVTRDIPAGVVAIGSPCRVLRKICERDYEYYWRDRKIGFPVSRRGEEPNG